MNEDQKFALTNIWQMVLFFWTVFVLLFCGLLANQAGFFGPPERVSIHQHSEFSLKVAEDGKTIYRYARIPHDAAAIIGRELTEELLSTVYPTPDAAMEAVEPVSGNPAYAHAVNVCWHESYSKISNQTGISRHRTWWRKDYAGYRYTTTSHDVLSNGYWVSTDVFKTRVRLSYCS